MYVSHNLIMNPVMKVRRKAFNFPFFLSCFFLRMEQNEIYNLQHMTHIFQETSKYKYIYMQWKVKEVTMISYIWSG